MKKIEIGIRILSSKINEMVIMREKQREGFL